MCELRESFYAFCCASRRGSETCTYKTLRRICEDCGIYCEGMGPIRVDIQFSKHLGYRQKEVDFEGFLDFIEGTFSDALACAKCISKQEAIEEITQKISTGCPSLHGPSSMWNVDETSRRLSQPKFCPLPPPEAHNFMPHGLAGRTRGSLDPIYPNGYKGMGTYDCRKDKPLS